MPVFEIVAEGLPVFVSVAVIVLENVETEEGVPVGVTGGVWVGVNVGDCAASYSAK